MENKELAKRKISKLGVALQKLRNLPESYTYIQIYQSTQELYFNENYDLVIGICNALHDYLSLSCSATCGGSECEEN